MLAADLRIQFVNGTEKSVWRKPTRNRIRFEEGAIELLVGLTHQYGEVDIFADGLLVLREDLRDPVLRARGAAWKANLCEALDACLSQISACSGGIGLLAATHWQGSLLWWSFDPKQKVDVYVEESLRGFIAKIAERR